MDGITLTAILYKIATSPDGGWRIQIDVDQSDSKAVLKLAELRDILLSIGIVPVEKSTENMTWQD